MATVKCYLEADARISTDAGTLTNNYYNSVLATNSGYDWRFVIRPDLSDIPSGAEITSVTFHIYKEGGSDSTTDETLYRLRRSWIETQVSGSKATSGVSWTTVGAESTVSDRYSTQAGNIAQGGDSEWCEAEITVSEFEALLTNNTGFLIKRTDGSSGDKLWTSREGSTVGSAYAPYFNVTYVSQMNQVIIIS